MKTLVAYMPVLHEGYRRFIESVEGDKELYLIGEDIQRDIPQLAKDIRKLSPEYAKAAAESLDLLSKVSILTKQNLAELEGRPLIMADDDVTRVLRERYFVNNEIQLAPVFLMWDKHNATKERPVVSEENITHDELAGRLIGRAETEARKSSDIWRHVGAVLAKEGDPLLYAHNMHLPSEYTPYENGDPRNWFHKGEGIEFSTAIHAEAAIISDAARRGISTEGCDLYLTVFPCPPCAKLIARSGIKRLYCNGGYAVLDGEEILNEAGVKVFFVE